MDTMTMKKHPFLKSLKKDARVNVIYSRVSTYKQKTDLENQINKITTYCQSKNIQINKTYFEY